MPWGLVGGLWIGMLALYILYYKRGKEEKKRVGAVVLAVILMLVVLIAASRQPHGAGAARYTYYINGVRVGSSAGAFSGNLLGAVGIGLVAALLAKGLAYVISLFGKNGEGISGRTLVLIGVFTLIFAGILLIVGLVMSGARGPGAMSYREAGHTLTIIGSLPLVPGALCLALGKRKT